MLQARMAVAVLAILSGACSSGAVGGVASTDASPEAGPSNRGACVTAGGECLNAGAFCKKIGPQKCDLGSYMNGECCLDVVTCTDASARTILASNYDQSCTVDTDCTDISEGNSCNPCDFSCANAAINVGALPKYNSDTANLPAVLAVDHGQCFSSCGGPVGTCCRNGTCRRGYPTCPFPYVLFPVPDAALDAEDGGGEDGDAGAG